MPAPHFETPIYQNAAINTRLNKNIYFKMNCYQPVGSFKTPGALQVTPLLVDWLDKHPIDSVIVSDKEAVNACLNFADDFRVIVEPACGAALSLIYDKAHILENYSSVLMIVCGGAGVTIQQLLTWQEAL